MAQEWYIMNTNHDTVSGFESDDFKNFAADGFLEAIQGEIGTSVEICNYDLSERKLQKVVVQNKTADTKLTSLSRQILAPIGVCRAGEYVYYKNKYWLITSLVDNNGIYEKGILALCNYLLSWQDEQGKIHQRWANITSGSQYNMGETSDAHTSVRNDQVFIYMPDDDDVLLIPHRKRFIIDKRCKLYEKTFNSNITIDTTKPLITYYITRTDNVLSSYVDSGYAEYMATQEEQHENDGYYVVDGKGYWLCDIPLESNDKNNILSCEIMCDEPIIYNGLEPNIFMAKFYDDNGEEVQVSPQWGITCDFVDNLNIEYIENCIKISVDNEKLLNKTFELSLNAFGYETTKINITIKGLL